MRLRMALDAKVSFLKQIEKGCEDKLTLRDYTALMQMISDVLQGFRMEELEQRDKSEKDDLLESFDALSYEKKKS